MEYLSDSPSKEYAFLQKKCLEPLLTGPPPSTTAQAKKPASFKRSMRAAELERETADKVIKVRARVLPTCIPTCLSVCQYRHHLKSVCITIRVVLIDWSID